MEKKVSEQIPVALLHAEPNCNRDRVVGELLSAATLNVFSGEKILVKPNLLRAQSLSCTDPLVVAAVCRYLLDCGAKVTVSDSPGFGRAQSVAKKIGLTQALAPLKLSFEPLGAWTFIALRVQDQTIHLPVARKALEADRIFSLPKVKAHSQMRLTLAVKNCFGVVTGAHKALCHTLWGKERSFFAECLVALFQKLPSVSACADGIIAMSRTGPSGGDPYPLALLGASRSAVALDEVLATILGQTVESLPLGYALRTRGVAGCSTSGANYVFPLASPQSFSCQDFVVPKTLLTTSFAPHRLFVSLCRRLWAALH